MRNWFNHRHHKRRYKPFYDDTADYNTNAKSYYDYLARFNYHLKNMTDFINRLMNRDIKFNDTESVKFNKKGDWIDNGECSPNDYDDVLNITADVKISNHEESLSLNHVAGSPFKILNGSRIEVDGVWSPDYLPAINGINSMIGDILQMLDTLSKKVADQQIQIDNLEQIVASQQKQINEHLTKINNLTSGLQKIVDNLFSSGAITSKNINNFTFNSNRNIATGNINLFGGTSDGNSFIKTSNSKTENDITAGY